MKNNIHHALITALLISVFALTTSFTINKDQKSAKEAENSYASLYLNDIEIQDLMDQYILEIKDIDLFEPNDVKIYNPAGDLIAQGNEKDRKISRLLGTSDLIMRQGNTAIYIQE